MSDDGCWVFMVVEALKPGTNNPFDLALQEGHDMTVESGFRETS